MHDSTGLWDKKQCTDNLVTSYVMEACHGQKQCNLTASPGVMGAVGCSSLYVYLKTVYACVEVRAIKGEFVDRQILTRRKSKIQTGNEILIEDLSLHEEIMTTPISISTIDDLTTEEIYNSQNIDPKEVIDLFFKNLITESSVTRQQDEPVYDNASVKTKISERQFTFQSEDINLDSLPLEQSDKSVGSISEYVQNNIRDIGLLAVIFLSISLVIILTLLIIYVGKTYFTKNSNYQVKEKGCEHIQTTPPCVDPNSSPYMLPVPDLFQPTDASEFDLRRNIDVKSDSTIGKVVTNCESIAKACLPMSSIIMPKQERMSFNSWNFEDRHNDF